MSEPRRWRPGRRGVPAVALVMGMVAAGIGCSATRAAGTQDAGLDVAAGEDGGDPGDAVAARDAGGRDAADAASGWTTAFEETFEGLSLPTVDWQPATYPDDGPFKDDGLYFTQQGIHPPQAYRVSVPFGVDGWLTIESYTRSPATSLADLVAVTPDPSGAANQVLRLASPAHTDATVIRPTEPLPASYRVSLRVGYAEFGDGRADGNNGYDDSERAEPWLDNAATDENGFYWLTILDSVPRPHNNVWIHHHRKVVFDSDNHYPPWMQIWDGTGFVASGEHPLMMFALDGRGAVDELTGAPFIAYAGGAWQPSGRIRAVDAYRPVTWYTVSIERRGDVYTMTVSGDFRYGGAQTYTATIDAAEQCVWHYNRAPLAADDPCVRTDSYPSLPGTSLWPPGVAYPDYFMFGDPHDNYYEGYVYYDDVRLEVMPASGAN